MKPTNWKSTAELIGITAIVGSLIFVGLQLQQDRAVALSQVFQSQLEATVEIDSTMAEHAEVWAKAGSGETLTTNEKIILERLVNMWRLRSFYESLSLTRIGSNGGGGAVNRFAITLHENPGARQVFMDHAARDEKYFAAIDQAESMVVFQRRVLELLDELDAMK